jgi:hypothetical protein
MCETETKIRTGIFGKKTRTSNLWFQFRLQPGLKLGLIFRSGIRAQTRIFYLRGEPDLELDFLFHLCVEPKVS